MKNKKMSLVNIIMSILLILSAAYFVLTLKDYNQEINVSIFESSNTVGQNRNNGNFNNTGKNKSSSKTAEEIKNYNLTILASRDIFPYKKEISSENGTHNPNDNSSQIAKKQLNEPVQSRNNTELEHSFEIIAISNIITDRRAIIRDNRSSETYIVKPGDNIKDYKVMRIYPEEVILSKNDRYVTISFGGND